MQEGCGAEDRQQRGAAQQRRQQRQQQRPQSAVGHPSIVVGQHARSKARGHTHAQRPQGEARHGGQAGQEAAPGARGPPGVRSYRRAAHGRRPATSTVGWGGTATVACAASVRVWGTGLPIAAMLCGISGWCVPPRAEASVTAPSLLPASSSPGLAPCGTSPHSAVLAVSTPRHTRGTCACRGY